MLSLTIVDRAGQPHVVKGRKGWSVMENIREHGFDELLALCGGCLSCATCHVHVDPEWFGKLKPMSADEDDPVHPRIRRPQGADRAGGLNGH
jgi:2Fe-2S ferredoxin